MNRSYADLKRIHSFQERYEYLKLDGVVGNSTFGFDRYLNQALYTSKRWLQVRNEVIFRDEGCDLGVPGYEIEKGLLIHHMNPITIEDLEERKDCVFDPEFLICVSSRTHNAIHFGDKSLLRTLPKERSPGDTCPWRR